MENTPVTPTEMCRIKVSELQRKLAKKATEYPEHRFTNLYDLLTWEPLMDWAFDTLMTNRGSCTAGTDRMDKRTAIENKGKILTSLKVALKSRTFTPSPVRRVYIPKPNGQRRPLGIPTLRGEAIPVYGDGSNIRDWIHVEDHCRAILSVFQRGQVGETYAIGANNEQRNIELVQKICKIMDELIPAADNPDLKKSNISRYDELIQFVTDRPGHDQRYAIDSSKIRNELGWEPKITFEEGLRQTVLWYLENLKWVEHSIGDGFSL